MQEAPMSKQILFWFGDDTEPELHTYESLCEAYPPGSKEAVKKGCRCTAAAADAQEAAVSKSCSMHFKMWQ